MGAVKEGVQQEGDAAGAGAEVQDAEGPWGCIVAMGEERGVRGYEGGEVGGPGFGFGSMSERSVAVGEGRKGGRGDTDRGISTPVLHRISKLPKGWSPRMYCRGFPLERSMHSRRSDFCRFEALGLGDRCSRSQRSSLRAE